MYSSPFIYIYIFVYTINVFYTPNIVHLLLKHLRNRPCHKTLNKCIDFCIKKIFQGEMNNVRQTCTTYYDLIGQIMIYRFIVSILMLLTNKHFLFCINTCCMQVKFCVAVTQHYEVKD